MQVRYPQRKTTIIGAGIIGAIEAYLTYLEAKKAGEEARVTMYEKNKEVTDTTTSHIVPSLTPDELLSVVPRGQELTEKLSLLFSDPGGIRVDDVKGVNDSPVAKEFIEQVQKYSECKGAHEERTQVLLQLGKKSMDLWQSFYNNADEELKQILRESNFNPCHEPENKDAVLHDGYRVDIIYKVENAKRKAEQMISDYKQLGYESCKILSPDEVKSIDPFLADFCESYSEMGESKERTWKTDAVALWRPGGCIDTHVFLPKFYQYLEKVMGEYINEKGISKKCFRLKFERQVDGIIYRDENQRVIHGLRLFGRRDKINNHQYEKSDYTFCPGEAVGTLKKLGFSEPAYAGFAGASLMLEIPIPVDQAEECSKLNDCMEVCQEGVVLAWQARIKNGKIFIGGAGTKAFYGDQRPNIDQEFAKNRNLLQLNMMNEVLPKFISLALHRETKGQQLTADDLAYLERRGIAKRWVGTRAVAADGVPTAGRLFNQKGRVENARCTTHLGSGGASFSFGAVDASQQAGKDDADELTKNVLRFGSSSRSY
jgi:hypothetical protein